MINRGVMRINFWKEDTKKNKYQNIFHIFYYLYFFQISKYIFLAFMIAKQDPRN